MVYYLLLLPSHAASERLPPSIHSVKFDQMLTMYNPYPNTASVVQPRPSTSSGPSRTLSDMALVRRRKSTGSKPLKTRSNTIPAVSTHQSNQRIASTSSYGNVRTRGPPTEPLPTPRSSAQFPATNVVSKSAPSTPKIKAIPDPMPVPHPQFTITAPMPTPLQHNLKFSTADRTILKELKRNISARAAQFVVKGAGAWAGTGYVRPGRKHHPYSRDEVPYPRSYEREVLDL